MYTVNRFEGNLLRIVRGILGQAPRAEVLALLSRETPRPAGLSRGAVEILQQMLAAGCVRLLARWGWRRVRHLRGDRPVEGRLWQRTPPRELGLTFSRNTPSLLLWLTAWKETASEDLWKPSADIPLTTGDRLLLFLTCRTVQGTPLADSLQRLSAWRHDGLCRLAFADGFAGLPSAEPIDWRPWLTGVGACIFEACQHELADRWVQMERTKWELTRADLTRAIGEAQEDVLNSLFDAVETHDRRDLCRFILMAADRLLGGEPPVQRWLRPLDVSGLTMGQRVRTYQAALALVRSLARLEYWQRQAVAIGYFDEGYAASQLWKSDWERYRGEHSCAHARAIVQRADPLRSAAAPRSPQSGAEQRPGEATE